MHTTAPFPYPGSSALLDGAMVQIHQRIDDETVLVFGKNRSCRAAIADLAAPPPPSLIEAWLEERVAPAGDYALFTPASQVADDYREWLRAREHAEAAPPSDYIFLRQMREAGHTPTRGLWREPGDSQSRTRVLFRFALRRTA